jgi:uncharacterized protein
MYQRMILEKLRNWSSKPNRKPLVLRGARQVGKTTVLNSFGQEFDNYLYFNLELPEDQAPFLNFTQFEILIQSIFFLRNKVYDKSKRNLIFIDEIQELPQALNLLRYFYEKSPELHVVAAGSLLETVLDQSISFPVGRVEFLVLRPVSFQEFLNAINETAALQQLDSIPLAPFAHDKLLSLFRLYAIIGGMPEIVKYYAETKDLTALKDIYESLISSYLDDVEKYASTSNQVQTIRHAIRSSFSEAGKRIKFQGFGKSGYGSREMGEALRTLEKVMILSLIYPVTNSNLPLQPDLKRSPRLQLLDTGMLNYFVGIQKEILGTFRLDNVYHGILIEHLVGQELLAYQFNALSSLNFWIREKKTSSAEVDYIYNFDGHLIPIEVKSGSEGKLKSLHLYMEEAPHQMAVRFYSGMVSINPVVTSNQKKYFLLNLPYYLAGKLESYLDWFREEILKMAHD